MWGKSATQHETKWNWLGGPKKESEVSPNFAILYKNEISDSAIAVCSAAVEHTACRMLFRRWGRNDQKLRSDSESSRHAGTPDESSVRKVVMDHGASPATTAMKRKMKFNPNLILSP